METELVVHMNKKNFLLGMIGGTLCIGILTYAYFWIHQAITIKFIRVLLEAIVVVMGSLYALVLAYAPFLIFDKQPTLILNQNGVWTHRTKLIPWSNIKDVAVYQYMGGPEFLGIYIHDTKSAAKQATLAGKMNIFWAKKFSYPPIHLGNLEVDNATIIQFAQQFLKKESSSEH